MTYIWEIERKYEAEQPQSEHCVVKISQGYKLWKRIFKSRYSWSEDVSKESPGSLIVKITIAAQRLRAFPIEAGTRFFTALSKVHATCLSLAVTMPNATCPTSMACINEHVAALAG